MKTLVLEFKEIVYDNEMKHSAFCLTSQAETIINESNIDNVFESIYCTFI